MDTNCFAYLFNWQAYDRSINLASQSYFVPESSSAQYLNYGTAVSEVIHCIRPLVSDNG